MNASRNVPLAIVALIAAVACLGGCSRSSGTDDAGPTAAAPAEPPAAAATPATAARVPARHRSSPVKCPSERGAGDADPRIRGDACSADADCSAGRNGRCILFFANARENRCSYDECLDDRDCIAGQACACRPAGSNRPNECVPAACTVDADCGEGGHCSPSVDFAAINSGVIGFFCHAPTDLCIDDVDCAGSAGPAACAWDPRSRRWACSTKRLLPP